MGFSQVVEENGVKKLAPITTPTSVTAQEAKTLALEAKTLAEAALPKAGGEMSGLIRFKNSLIDRDVNPEASQYLNEIFGSDKNGANIMSLYTAQRVNGDIMSSFNLFNVNEAGEPVQAAISFNLQRDGGSYMTIGTPGPSTYVGAVINKKYAIDHYAENFSNTMNIHVAGANASDTADLYDGRGLSENMPFATLDAALALARARYRSANYGIRFILHDDIEFSGAIDPVYSCASYTITSDSTIRTITTTDGIAAGLGTAILQYINIDAQTGSKAALLADALFGNSLLVINSDVQVSGTGNVLLRALAGSIFVRYPLGGNFTGMKYKSDNGGIINGIANINTGTEAGVCDVNSKAF